MIELRNISKSYPNPETGKQHTVLSIESLSLALGDQIAVHGASGVGKTTLLHLISGMLLPDSGSVSVNGTMISTLSEAERDRYRARTIGYVFQTFNLLDGYTALENVMLGMIFTGNGVDKAKAMEVLSSVGLQDRMHYQPSQLSVGQQQRVCIARALVNNPAVILADEPTGNLDPANSAEILHLLKSAAKDKILVIVTHEPDVLKQFDNKLELTVPQMQQVH